MTPRKNFYNPHVWHNRRALPQDAQKGRPARPQASRNRRRTLLGYVEDFDEPRTKLAAFFSILLGSRRKLLRQERHVFLLKGEMDDQEDDPHADRRVGDIEGRPMVGVHIDIEKVDHLAKP